MSAELPPLSEEQKQAIFDQAIGEAARKKGARFWAWIIGGGGAAIAAAIFGTGNFHKPQPVEYHRHIESSPYNSSSVTGLAALIISLKNDFNGIRSDLDEVKEGQKTIIANQAKFAALVDSTPTGIKIKKEYEHLHPRPFLGYNN